MQEQIEGIIKVSSKGQIVIPRKVRKKLRVKRGDELLVLTCNEDILLRKTSELSLEDISDKIERVTSEQSIDVDKLMAEAVEWARRKGQSSLGTNV